MLNYQIRTSTRARYVRLQVTAKEGLTVVVPQGFDRRRLAAILEENRGWVESQRQRIAERLAGRVGETLWPERLELAAIGEVWSVAYEPCHTRRIGVSDAAPGKLVVYGAVDDGEGCREALRLWLRRRAREALVPQLAELARQNGFCFQEALIRGQKRRWASCTAQGKICLSYKLLFLEPWAVRSVLLHELCHTLIMDHSQRFWTLLARFDPHCKSTRKAMRESATRIPGWVEG